MENTQVFIAEATALHQSIILAIQEKILNSHIEGDNLLVINVVKSPPPRQIAHIIHDIKTNKAFEISATSTDKQIRQQIG